MENGNTSTVFLHKVSSTGDLADNLKKKKNILDETNVGNVAYPLLS